MKQAKKKKKKKMKPRTPSREAAGPTRQPAELGGRAASTETARRWPFPACRAERASAADRPTADRRHLRPDRETLTPLTPARALPRARRPISSPARASAASDSRRLPARASGAAPAGSASRAWVRPASAREWDRFLPGRKETSSRPRPSLETSCKNQGLSNVSVC